MGSGTETSLNMMHDTIGGTPRGSITESESNNAITLADDVSGVTKPITINGQLSSLTDIDHFKISLDGDDNPVENLTVVLTNLDPYDYAWYDYFYLEVYGAFEDKYLLMKVVSCQVYDWYQEGDCPPACINAFATGFYYIKVSFTNQYHWENTIDYSLRLTTREVNPTDDNQVIQYAEKITDPIFDQSIRMDTDIFDWYYIDSPDSDNYDTNFSISVDITASLPIKTASGGGASVSFVTEVHVLIYYRHKLGNYKLSEEIIGNMYHKFDQPDPIMHYEWTDKDTTYIGIYVQTFGRTEDGSGEYIAGEGYCDGWVEYSIEKIQAKPMIPPVISNASVQSPIGKVYHRYTYNVIYTDENNDGPKKITITIDNGYIGPEPMTKANKSDRNYMDGCVYKYMIEGTDFNPSLEEHNFWVSAEDVERKAIGLDGDGPIITDNILPTPRPSASSTYFLYEDDPISYLDLNTTFEDIDNDTLYYRLSNNNQNWSDMEFYSSENITIKVVNDPNNSTNSLLEFRPQENMYNRLSGQAFGSEIVYINVSDDNPDRPSYPDKDGALSPAHYMPNPFELKVIIISVNDPPEIKRPFYSHPDFFKGEMVIVEDHKYTGLDLNTVFWDPVENDPLSFSVRNKNNIEVIFYTNGTVDFVPKENWTGTESLEIVANDGFNTISDALKVKVTSVNDNPVLNYTVKQIIFEDAWCNLTFSGYDRADSDLIYFETNLKEKLELAEDDFSFNKLTGELSFIPRNDDVGTYKDIMVTIKDYNGGSTSQFIVLEIKNTPDAPEPTIVNPITGERYLNTERIEFQGEFLDPDDNILVEPHYFRWHSNINDNLSTQPNFKAELLEGEHTITFEVSDSIFKKSRSITILVLSKTDLDTDSDGIPDYWEKLFFMNHFDPLDAELDPDKDTFSNLEEYLGMDGKPGGNDYTDPRDPNDYPDRHYEPESKEETSLYLSVSIAAIIIIILVLSVFFIIIRKRRKRAQKAEAEEKTKEKPEEKIVWRDMYGRKYKVYSYEPNYIICHNCLERVETQIPIRPLVVTCPKCNTRGVLYK